MKKLLIILFVLCLCVSVFGQFIPIKMFGQQLSGPFAEGLVLYWRGIEAGNAVDESFGENHGIINGPAWKGDSLVFNGTTDIVSFGTGRFNIEATQEFTVIVWAFFDTITNSDGIFGRSQFVRPFDITGRSIGEIQLRTRTASGVISSGSGAGSIVVGQWYQIAVTFTISTQTIYVNGVLKTSDAPAGGNLNWVNTTTQMTLGDTGATDAIDGRIKLLYFYNRALSASEILDLYINPDLPMQQDPIWQLFSPAAPPSGIVPIIQAHTRRRRAG